jgi:hypothetical protein
MSGTTSAFRGLAQVRIWRRLIGFSSAVVTLLTSIPNHGGLMPTKRRTGGDRALVPVQVVERRIAMARGHKVMVDSDLAELYQVETRVLVQAIKRNSNRFPADFMFQLSKEETAAMRSQIVIASKRNVRHRPYAFTEHGALMLSSVLKSERAAKMGIYIVRVFVKLREMLSTNKDLAREFEQLRQEQQRQG